MSNDVDKYEADKIELPVLEMRMNKLGDTLLANATDDRTEARKVKLLIEQEIEEIKAEYTEAVKKYEQQVHEAETLEDPVARKHELSKIWRPKRPGIALLISELNKCLEVGITSSDNIVKLLDLLAKIKLRSKSTSEFDEIQVANKRLDYLKGSS